MKIIVLPIIVLTALLITGCSTRATPPVVIFTHQVIISPAAADDDLPDKPEMYRVYDRRQAPSPKTE
jgi:hypothetical protein